MQKALLLAKDAREVHPTPFRHRRIPCNSNNDTRIAGILRLRLIFAPRREDHSSLRMTDLEPDVPDFSAKQNVPDSVRVLGRLLISPPPSAAQQQSSVEQESRIWLCRAITKLKNGRLRRHL
jgi:hypothetical protein